MFVYIYILKSVIIVTFPNAYTRDVHVYTLYMYINIATY